MTNIFYKSIYINDTELEVSYSCYDEFTQIDILEYSFPVGSIEQELLELVKLASVKLVEQDLWDSQDWLDKFHAWKVGIEDTIMKHGEDLLIHAIELTQEEAVEDANAARKERPL